MKKIFSFTKKKKFPSSTPDNGSVVSVGYELKEKDLGKVHKAASVGDVAKLKQLAKKNDINQLDKENRTALHIACASGHVEVVHFLVESKAKLNLCDNQNRSALMKAVQGQHERCVNVLLENHAEPNLVDINGNTALHLTANIPSISTAMLLLEHEADINSQNKEGFTPLTVAVRENHVEMAEFLLKEGADVNVKDQGKRSPLMIAAGSGQIGMVRLLLQFDADITLKDTNGWSSDDHAVINGHHACSHLIIEHGTKRNAMPSPSHQVPGKKKKKTLLGSPSLDVEAGFSLGGPATDKDDAEDNSQTESLSRASKSAAADWPSSEDDDESELIPKKPQRVNLRKLIASKKGDDAAPAQPNRSLSGTESESESEDIVQRIPSLPKALPSSKAPQHPVDPSPASFSKAPQMTSTLLPNYRKKEDSTPEDDDDDKGEEDEDDDDEEEEEEEGDHSDENDQNEDDDEESPVGATFVPEREVSKDKQRDFLSELGLEKGEEEQDSWDSESHSENPNKTHNGDRSSRVKDQEEMSIIQEENKEDLFYIPSFLRGEGSDRMAILEPRRSVGRPRGSQGVVVRNNDSDGKDVDNNGVAQQKETEKGKWEPLSVLSKLEGETEKKTDLMEELGLGDVDDLEDASDWDSASTTSRRTLPGRRMPSPGVEELPECSTPSDQEQEQEIPVAAHPTAQKSVSLDKRMSTLPSPPALTSHSAPQPLPHPQPRARKMVPQKPESEEGFSVHEPSAMAWDSESNLEPEQQQQKEKDDALHTSDLDLNKPHHSDLVASESGEKDDELSDQQSPKGGDEAGEDIPWKKSYEKLWVEVEKREVKKTYRNVTEELKEKFGELIQSNRSTAEDDTDEEQAQAESPSVKEASSNEEEGQPIVRPTARARTTVLLTIPEQRESGLEDSVTDSAENSEYEDRTQTCEPPDNEGSKAQDLELLNNSVLEEHRSPSPQFSPVSYSTTKDCSVSVATKTFSHGNVEAMSSHDLMRRQPDEAQPEPIQQLQLELSLGYNTAVPDKAAVNCANSEEDPEEFAQSQPPSLSIHSAATPGVSDEELEEDMQRFKHEVGMLKVVFLHLEKEKTQLQREVGKERTETTMEVQRSTASWDAGGPQEGVEVEKPETSLGHRKELSSRHGATQRDQQLTATDSITQKLGSRSPKRSTVFHSTSRGLVQLHLPLQQNYNNNKREGQAVAVEGTSQLELVRGARHSRAPQTNTHVNGDPLSVFDDSTLSEVSDDEGRSPSAAQRRDENPGEMEMGEDFDELTQSSDTATDDIDSPTSGYRHASLLIQKLDSASLDSRSMVKVQSIFHEYERTIQKARSRHGHLSDKVSQLEMERAELKNSMEEIKDVKSALERHQLELQTEVNNLKFQLKQEQENRRNATMMYNTTKEKLKRTEEQQQLGVEQRQRVELTLRNLELEMRTLVNNMKQLEEDHSETQRLLAQERSARTLQENLFNSHLRKQQEIEEENRRNTSKSSEALSQLTEASDREKELIQQSATLQEELSILRIELEHSRANSSLEESRLAEESEALKECLEDTRRDLKLNKEALTQTAFQYNSQLATLKSELAVTTTHLEHERQTREMLEAEVESTRNRLAGALQEAERCQAARADTEKALLREKEEHQHIKDKHAGEAAKQREAVSSLSQKLTKAEAHVNSMENEVHRATLQLTEKALLLEALQREKDQAAARVKELETTLQAEKELANRAGARQEATQERLVQAQSEGMLLRQQLEEAQNKGVAKEHAVTDAQERFSDILSKLRSDCEERVQLVEERSKELASKAADLRDQVYKLEEEKNEREAGLRQLQQELADSLKKLSMSEASLEVNTRYRNDLEEEKARLLKDIDRLKGKLEESEDQYVQSERRINSLKSSVDEKERELTVAAQKLQEALSASAGSDTTIKQLEEAMQRLEIENARLEAAAKQQSNKIDALQKGAQEAAMVFNLFQPSDCSPGGGVRSRLEDLVTNLQGSKMNLEDQLSREVQKQSMLCHTAQDSQALWEEELKSRSKLGLRLAELEKEKGELNTQMEIERKKAKKISEQKKAMDTRLDQEMKRNTELQKEMYRLRALVKTAKKKLQDTGGAEFGSPMSSLRMEMGRPSQAEGAIGRMKEKVDDLQVQLEKEASRCSQLEKVNGELKEQLASQKSLSRSNERLERSKRQLEDEVSGLRRQMEAGLMDQSQAEQYRRNAEERARQEIRQKLEEVNLFLQTQAASQEALDQIKSANEANLRSQLEQRIRELEGELGRARTTQQDSLNQRDSTRTELEQYHKLYTEELRLRKSLAAKLERANNRLSEANAKLLNEHHRKSFLTSSMVNGSLVGPSLDVGSLGSPGTYGATLGPLNRSLGVGLPLLSPMTEGQNSRVEDYLAKMQSELDRNISKELVHATAELEGSARMSPVGSASGVDLDPVSRATQQYLEVLKKNYMI
ncbi:LOW QUALITY PROTEIN: ankyrin repeat domain-containing protein 26 [Diretmus argenteus]